MKFSRRKIGVIVLVLAILAGILVLSEIFLGKGIPFTYHIPRWSIGIYTGDSPFDLKPAEGIKNPVLSAADITDADALFVADPFLVQENGQWYMFFEVLNKGSRKGEIGLAVSLDGSHWAYKQIVLCEPFHLSYPYVFNWQGQYYMIPESQESRSVRLYRAVNFPFQWAYETTLIEGRGYADSSLVSYNKRWWLFTTLKEENSLYLYSADRITGPWQSHPQNPVITQDANLARCAGRILTLGDRVIRYAQDDDPVYGGQLRAFKVITLTEFDYKEEEVEVSPVLEGSGEGWNKDGMHHADVQRISAGKWLACVDGFYSERIFSLKPYIKKQGGYKSQ